jgi:hypothetical protein
MELNTYRAIDRRVYNGAPCSDMSREWAHTLALEKRMKAADHTASCTYFPLQGQYLVFVNSNILENPDLKGPPRELTGNFHNNKQDALIEAILLLEHTNPHPNHT